ncbi:DNA replication complex GINS protein PSF3 [Halotydeus destructor]|nr:DNA replication complex GINS protein PSF3 [Halotydeus destructor]
MDSTLGTTSFLTEPSFSLSQSQHTQSTGHYQGKYSEDYLNVDDIMTLSQRITSVFREPVNGLGFIDPASESKNIGLGTKIEPPLWMAKTLQARKLVTLELPKGYNETYREILDAGATSVDLNKLGPHFYRFGKHLVELNLKDSDEVAKSLVDTFHQRFHKLLDFSLSAASDTVLETLSYQSSLDKLELEILEAGRKATTEFKKWENRSSEKITANEMVAQLKKRKKAALQDLDTGNSQKRLSTATSQ